MDTSKNFDYLVQKIEIRYFSKMFLTFTEINLVLAHKEQLTPQIGHYFLIEKQEYLKLTT